MKVKRRKDKIGDEKSFFKLFEINSKKGISPVVATGLLLVVAVISVMSFNTWFNTFQSGVLSNIETKSNDASLGGSLKIDALIRNKLYILNNLRDNLSIKEIKVDKNLCNLSNVDNLSLGLNEITLEGCLDNLSTDKPLISLVTDTKIVSKYIYIKDANVVSSSEGSGSASLDCSSLNGGEWILVPGNSDLGTSDFCVMKYEAKATTSSLSNLFNSIYMNCGNGNDYGTNNCSTDGSVNITSKPEYDPLTQVTQVEARQLCENLGPGYHLITNAEWVTIARNAENVASNWADGVIGSTVASGGGLKRGNIGIDDNVSYDGANPADRSSDTNSKAMLTLSNGETIWDLSGNVWEWNNDTFNNNTESSLGQGSFGWYEWTQITGYDYLEPFDSTLYSTNGVGRVYVNTHDAFPSGTVHGFLRGGCWSDGADAGAFALNLDFAPSYSAVYIGFRCSYSP